MTYNPLVKLKKVYLTDRDLTLEAFEVYIRSCEYVYKDRQGKYCVGDINYRFVHEDGWLIDEVNEFFEDMSTIIGYDYI